MYIHLFPSSQVHACTEPNVLIISCIPGVSDLYSLPHLVFFKKITCRPYIRSMIHFELIFVYDSRYDQLLLLYFCIEAFKFSSNIYWSAVHDVWDLSSLIRN